MHRVPGLLFPNGAAARDSVPGAEAKSSGENDSQTRTCGQGDSGGEEMEQRQLRWRRAWWLAGKTLRFTEVLLGSTEAWSQGPYHWICATQYHLCSLCV